MMKIAVLKSNVHLIIPFFLAVFLSLFLYYIDEAKYSFVGIFQFTNLFFLWVYVIIFLGIQGLIQIGVKKIRLIRNKSIPFRNMVSAIILLGLLFIFFIIIP